VARGGRRAACRGRPSAAHYTARLPCGRESPSGGRTSRTTR